MASRPAVELTGGLDLNAEEQEGGSTDVGAGLASDPGRDGSGECVLVSGGGDSTLREAGDASCGARDAVMDVAEKGGVSDIDAVVGSDASGRTEVEPVVVGCSGRAEIVEGLDLREEKQNDVEEGICGRFVDGCKGDQEPESGVFETGSTTVVDVEAAVAVVETVPDRIKLAEFGKSSNKGETIEKFESSSVEKANSENDALTGNLVEGGIPTTEDEAAESHLIAADESGGQGKLQMDVMETENVIETAKTIDAVDPEEVKGIEAHFPDSEANVGGKKNDGLENENRAELVEEDLFHKEKEESLVTGLMGCDSVDGHLQDKLHILDLAASEMKDGSSCTHELEVSAVDVECAVENAAILTAAAFDGDEVERLVDTSDPGPIQVEVSDINNQTEVKEGHLSYKDGNQTVDGRLQPDEGAAGSTVCEAEKRSCDDEKPEAGYVNAGCLSGRESSTNLAGVEDEKLEGLADQADEAVGVMEISDKSEPTGEGISCPENASQVANHDSVDEHLDVTEMDVRANALDAGCTMGDAEAYPPVTLDRVEAERLGISPDHGITQVEVMEISNGIRLPGHGLSIAEKNQSVLNEVVSHAVVEGHLHAKGVLVPGDTDQNEALIPETSVVAGEMEDVLDLGMNQDKESPELDGETKAGELSIPYNDQNQASILEMPIVDTSQNAQDEENAIHQKELREMDPYLVCGTAIDQVNNDERDSDSTNPIVEVNITDKDTAGEYLLDVGNMVTTESDAVTNVQVVKADGGDIHLFNDDPVDSEHILLEEVHLVQRVVSAETETDDVKLGRRDMKHKEYTVMAHDDSVSNPPVMMSESSFAQLVDDNQSEKGDASFPSSGLILEAKSSDECSADGEFVMDGLNLSVEISMPRASELSQIENVVYSGIESADILVSENQETESQTVSSLADDNHSVSATGANSSVGRGQNMLMEYKVLKEDESPTIEFCQNAEIGRNSEADQKSVVPGGNILNVGSDAGTNDDQNMVIDEQETTRGTDKQTVKYVSTRPVASVKDIAQCACFHLPSKDEDGFSTSDLVWGKVKSHPWWPGQIFDPADASDLALKYQKKDNFLVAYFGDKTFAWCDESQLKHFEIYFSQMEKQSSSDVFVGAVNGALNEVSRRMGLGMTCFCFPEVASATLNYQKVENTGIREGSNGYTLDRSAILSYFEPGRLLEYVKALAKFPDGGTDRLGLVIANAQLKAFYRSKGYPELPSFQFGGGLSESDAEIPCSNSESIEEDTIEHSSPTLSDLISGKQKSQGFSKQKHVLEDGKKRKSLSELMEAEGSQLANGANTELGIKADLESVYSSSKKHKVTDSDSSDSGKAKKKRLDSLGDIEIKVPSTTISSSFKVGDCIRRVASQLTGSSPILKPHSEISLKKVSKDDSVFDVFVSDGFSYDIMQSPSFELEHSDDYSSPYEMLSQLCLAARDPMKGYSDLSIISSFFTEFRNYCTSSAGEMKHPEKAGAKRDRKRKVDDRSTCSEMMEPDHMQDSYWSDLISQNSPAKNKVETHTRSQRRKRKSSGQTSTLTLVPILQGAEHLQVGIASPSMMQAPSTDRSIIRVEEKMVDECTPTALILNFNGSNSLPSETDLIRIFSRYGPLKEAATEVQRKNNRVKVVFKRRADAEIAFSSAGKYSIFGPSLLSYRLRYLPSTPDTSPDTKQPDKMDALLVESSHLEIPGNLHSSMSSALETNLQGKSDIVLMESSNTYILHPTMSSASPDAKQPDKGDALLVESSNMQIPGNPPSPMSSAPDTNLQDRSDTMLTESSNTNILHPPMCNASPDTNIQDKSDAILTENNNTNIPSNLLPSASDDSPDTNLQNPSDAVPIEISNANLLSHLHPRTSDASSDTNLQDKSDEVPEINLQDKNDAVLTENSNTSIPSQLHPTMSDASLDNNLQEKSDAVLIERSNTNLPGNLHPSMCDASPETNLQYNIDAVLTESSNTNIPSNLHVSTLDASPDTKPEDKSDAALQESSNMDISAQAQREVVLDTMQVASEDLVVRVAEVDEQAG